MGRTLVRIFVGICCILLGLQLDQFGKNPDKIINAACSEQSSGIPCEIVKFALNDLGITGLSSWLLAAGFVVIILSDFLEKLVSRAFAYAADRVASNIGILNGMLSNKKVNKKDMKEIIHSIFKNYTGIIDNTAADFSAFFLDIFMDHRIKEGGFWRRQYNGNIVVGKLLQNNILNQRGYLSWEETVTFEVLSPRSGGRYLHTSRSSINVSKKDISDVINIWKYTIKKGNTDVFSFEDYRTSLTPTIMKKRGGFSDKILKVYFKNKQLFIEVKTWINIETESVLITIDEKSVIHEDEMEFVQGLLEATKGFVLRFHIVDDYEVSLCTASPRHYKRGSEGDVHIEHSDVKAEITTGGWVLPGIAAVITWKKRSGAK